MWKLVCQSNGLVVEFNSWADLVTWVRQVQIHDEEIRNAVVV